MKSNTIKIHENKENKVPILAKLNLIKVHSDCNNLAQYEYYSKTIKYDHRIAERHGHLIIRILNRWKVEQLKALRI